ncbi:MAG: hypothetical protein U9N63_10485 [Pseudomonadota bacterium]|nr:hypothetical protein [Pseudomonadota bacterium]
MFKKISLRLPLIVLFAVFFLIITSVGAFAEKRGAGLRQAVEYSHICQVPYNIEDYGYITGLHVVADWQGDLDFTFRFFCGGQAYAVVNKKIGPEGWTGLPSQLLPNGVDLEFPTLIYVYSQVDSDYTGPDDENFWVTQFVFLPGSGFSHQTFTSHELNPVLY